MAITHLSNVRHLTLLELSLKKIVSVTQLFIHSIVMSRHELHNTWIQIKW